MWCRPEYPHHPPETEVGRWNFLFLFTHPQFFTEKGSGSSSIRTDHDSLKIGFFRINYLSLNLNYCIKPKDKEETGLPVCNKSATKNEWDNQHECA